MAQPGKGAKAPRRFVRAKLWATRLCLVALVALGFGVVVGVTTHSLTGAAVGAIVGAAATLRSAMRIADDDIHF